MLRQEQSLEKHAALLRDEVFSVILGRVYTQHGTASRNRKIKGGSKLGEGKVFESYHLSQVLNTPITGSGHVHKVTFRSLDVRLGSVSSTTHLVPQPVSFNLSRIPNVETSGKDIESKAEGKSKTPHHKLRRMKNDASMRLHSLQLVAEEFRKTCKPKIQAIKGGYQANTMLVFNSGLKDVGMCIKECNLTNLEAFQLVKDYTTESARGAVEFYLNTNSMWNYEELIEHLRTLFASGKHSAHWLEIFTAKYNDHRKQKMSLPMSCKF